MNTVGVHCVNTHQGIRLIKERQSPAAMYGSCNVGSGPLAVEIHINCCVPDVETKHSNWSNLLPVSAEVLCRSKSMSWSRVSMKEMLQDPGQKLLKGSRPL